MFFSVNAASANVKSHVVERVEERVAQQGSRGRGARRGLAAGRQRPAADRVGGPHRRALGRALGAVLPAPARGRRGARLGGLQPAGAHASEG